MKDVVHRADIGMTQIHLNANRIHRQKGKLFKVDTLDTQQSRIDSLDRSGIPASETNGIVHFPAKCGIRQGEGDFLFVGRIRLQRALLKCAPRIEDFEDVWRQAVRTGSNICVLD